MILRLYLTIQLIGVLTLVGAQPTISVLPETPYITKENTIQYLDFDFILTGQKNGKYTLDKIELKVFDKAGNVQQRMKVADEGMVSGFISFPKTKIKRDKSISLFNPFYFFGDNVQLHRLEFHFTFNEGTETVQVVKEVFPYIYDQRTPLLVPLKGSAIVDSGFDHYAHHRRMNTTHWGMKLLKISRNITRYAIDLAPVDSIGKIYKGSGKKLEDYYGYGQSVFAPGDGKIVEVVTDQPDNEVYGKLAYGTFAFIKNPKLASGNYIVLDHLNGEVSLLAHLKNNSIEVELGQTVNAGDFIGKIGNSGDSTYPHLHYQLENEHSLETQTFPAKFANIQLLNGEKVTEPAFCNTGDLVVVEQ